MGSEDLKSALQNANEVELTVTGRKSGQESSRPIWFVEEGDKVLLLPVGGSGANWFKNIQRTPTVGLAADGCGVPRRGKADRGTVRSRPCRRGLQRQVRGGPGEGVLPGG
jgi:hypothetical protein